MGCENEEEFLPLLDRARTGHCFIRRGLESSLPTSHQPLTTSHCFIHFPAQGDSFPERPVCARGARPTDLVSRRGKQNLQRSPRSPDSARMDHTPRVANVRVVQFMLFTAETLREIK